MEKKDLDFLKGAAGKTTNIMQSAASNTQNAMKSGQEDNKMSDSLSRGINPVKNQANRIRNNMKNDPNYMQNKANQVKNGANQAKNAGKKAMQGAKNAGKQTAKGAKVAAKGAKAAGKKAAATGGKVAAKAAAKGAAAVAKVVGAKFLIVAGLIVLAIIVILIVGLLVGSFLSNASFRVDEEAAEKDIRSGTAITSKYDRAFFDGTGVTRTESNGPEDKTLLQADGSYNVQSAERHDFEKQYVKIGKVLKGLMDKAIANASKKYPITVQKALRAQIDGMQGYQYYGGNDFYNGINIHGKKRIDYGCPLVDFADFTPSLDDNSAKIYTQLPRAIAAYSVSRIDMPPWEGYFWDIKGATFFTTLNEDLYKFEYDVYKRKQKAYCTPKGSRIPIETEYDHYYLNARISEGNMEKLFDAFFKTGKGRYYQMQGDTIVPKNGFYYPNIQLTNPYGSVKDTPFYPTEMQYKKSNDLTTKQTDMGIKQKFSLFSLVFKPSLFQNNGKWGGKKQYGAARSDEYEVKYTFGREDSHFDGEGTVTASDKYSVAEGNLFAGGKLGGWKPSGKFRSDVVALGRKIVQASNQYGSIGRYNWGRRWTHNRGATGKELDDALAELASGKKEPTKLGYFDCSSFTTYLWAVGGVKVRPNTKNMYSDFLLMQRKGLVTIYNLKGSPGNPNSLDNMVNTVRQHGKPGDLLLSYGHVVMLTNPNATGSQEMYIESNTQNGQLYNTDIEGAKVKSGRKQQHGMFSRSYQYALGSFRFSASTQRFVLVHLNA